MSAADDDGEDIGIQLLADILTIFDAEKSPKLPSTLIVERLLALEDRPWPEMPRTNKPLTTNAMARLLKPFKIRPSGTIRVGASTSKGYARTAFESAWIAYLLYDTPSQPTQRHNPGAEPVSKDSQPSHESNDVTDGIGPKAKEAATCDGVSDGTGSICEYQDAAPITEPAGGTDTAEPDATRPATVTLVCAACESAFDYTAGKRGRRPLKCAACRSNGARDHAATKKDDPRQMDIEEKIAVTEPMKPTPASPEVERMTNEVRAGLRCAYCGMGFTDQDGEPVEIAGKLYHADDSCAGTIRRRLAKEQEAQQ
jgi:hypothetical protein